jgi:uncharacterized protein (TIGR00255 family)
MTGYGRGEGSVNGCSLLVEVKSVNNRYLDCNVRLPRVYVCAEEPIRALVKDAVARGKVDVFVTVEHTGEEPVTVALNEGLAAGYCRALGEMEEKFGVRNDLTAGLLARLPDVFRVEKAPEDLEAVSEALCGTARAALEDFDRMRSREGEKLAQDLLGRLDTLERLNAQVEERGPERVTAYRDRLYQKLQEVLGDRQLDESRVLTEAALFADRVAVDEETVRLRSHIQQFRDMVAQGSPIGRKLDFLIQEMNRETNTIGSKANDLELSTVCVEMKAELEKLREQVQNVE